MNRLVILTGAFVFSLIQSCTTQKHATTIERDKENPCIIRMVIQIGIVGTARDVIQVRDKLESCFAKECFVPCPNDSTRGCKLTTNIIVKNWSEIKEDDKWNYHRVEMVDNDGLPSNAMLGQANTHGVSGTWRRDAFGNTYCHEVLHFCGLDDKYCSRLYDSVTRQPVVELQCDPPPDPQANCCTPTADHSRCSSPCDGHNHNLMGDSRASLSCNNLRDVLALAGMGSCPEECCQYGQTYHASDAAFAEVTYLHFGDATTDFGATGLGLGYTKQLTGKYGVTLGLGYNSATEERDNLKVKNQLFNISAGINYLPPQMNKPDSRFIFSSHALLGITRWSQKFVTPTMESNNAYTSLNLTLGALIQMKLNQNWNLRLLGLDYSPTFFGNAIQHNYKLGVGLSCHLR